MLFVGRDIAKRKEENNIFNYNEQVQIYFEDASSGKLEKKEIVLSENEVKNLVNQLAAYSSKLSTNTLKKEFLCWYTIKLNDEITIQIDAEFNYSDSDKLTYMYVIQHNVEPVTLYGTFIDSTIVADLNIKH